MFLIKNNKVICYLKSEWMNFKKKGEKRILLKKKLKIRNKLWFTVCVESP